MKTLFALFTAASLTLAAPALAEGGVNFSGKWKGTGKLIRHSPIVGNDESPCTSIEMTIEHTPHQYATKHYRAICGLLDSEWGPDVFEIRGTTLIQYDQEVGSIEGNVLKSTVPDGGVVYAFNLRLNETAGAEPTLDTYYGTKNLIGTMVIEGRLEPVK